MSSAPNPAACRRASVPYPSGWNSWCRSDASSGEITLGGSAGVERRTTRSATSFTKRSQRMSTMREYRSTRSQVRFALGSSRGTRCEAPAGGSARAVRAVRRRYRPATWARRATRHGMSARCSPVRNVAQNTPPPTASPGAAPSLHAGPTGLLGWRPPESEEASHGNDRNDEKDSDARPRISDGDLPDSHAGGHHGGDYEVDRPERAAIHCPWNGSDGQPSTNRGRGHRWRCPGR